MSQSILYYVYKVTCKSTGEFYYGYRTNHVKHNRQPEDDIWIKYFTSSFTIRDLIEKYGKDNFCAEIVFKSPDLDECYWFEQERIKENINDQLLLNHYYMDKALGHRRFRSKEHVCIHCKRLIGSGNISVHIRSCSLNPLKKSIRRLQKPCKWCGTLRGPGVLERHELACKNNPSPQSTKYAKTGESACQHCKKMFNNIGLGKHERRCEQNFTSSSNITLCDYCNLHYVKKNKSQHLRNCSAAIKIPHSRQYKLPCPVCKDLIGSCAIARHRRACKPKNLTCSSVQERSHTTPVSITPLLGS